MSVHKVCVDCSVSLLCISGYLPHVGIFHQFTRLHTLYEIRMNTRAGVTDANIPTECPRVEFVPASMEHPRGRGRIRWGPPPESTQQELRE